MNKLFEDFRHFLNERKSDVEYQTIANSFLNAIVGTINEIKETSEETIETKYFTIFLKRTPNSPRLNYNLIQKDSLVKKVLKDYKSQIPEEQRTIIVDREDFLLFKHNLKFEINLTPRLSRFSELGSIDSENLDLQIGYSVDKEKLEDMKTMNPWIFLKDNVLPQFQRNLKSVIIHEITHAIDNIRAYDKENLDFGFIHDYGPKSMKDKSDFTDKETYASRFSEINARAIETKYFIYNSFDEIDQQIKGDSKGEIIQSVNDLSSQNKITDSIFQIASSIIKNDKKDFINGIAGIEEISFWDLFKDKSKTNKEYKSKMLNRLLEVFESMRQEYLNNPEEHRIYSIVKQIEGIS